MNRKFALKFLNWIKLFLRTIYYPICTTNIEEFPTDFGLNAGCDTYTRVAIDKLCLQVLPSPSLADGPFFRVPWTILTILTL